MNADSILSQEEVGLQEPCMGSPREAVEAAPCEATRALQRGIARQCVRFNEKKGMGQMGGSGEICFSRESPPVLQTLDSLKCVH